MSTSTAARPRNSSIELLRILAMLSIIAHHMIVHSPAFGTTFYSPGSLHQEFINLWGVWGKISINTYVLISGYFLCTMTLTRRRYLKLLCEVIFYGLAVMVAFALKGYTTLTLGSVAGYFVGLVQSIGHEFAPSFLVFYAFVPFYNRLIDHLTRRELAWLIWGLLAVFTGTSTLFLTETLFQPTWFMTLYFLAAYLRLYPIKRLESLRFSAWMLVASVTAGVVSVIIGSRLPTAVRDVIGSAHLLVDSNKVLALAVALSAFLTFKNIKPFHSRIINFLAAGTFGVLLIHDANYDMRMLLWHILFNPMDSIHYSLPVFIARMAVIPPAVFVFCSGIDAARRRWIEKPLFDRRLNPAPQD